MEIGCRYSKKVIADEQTIQGIAKVSGDINPIHLSDEYAKQSIFGKRIAHALFCQNIISMIIGNYMPGAGAVLISQTFKYRKPVYVGDEIETIVAVEKILTNNRYLLSTTCKNQKAEVVLEGESVVQWQER